MAATQAEADIHLEGVSKRFADMTAVDDLTLSIPRGSFFAMLGPSGCGKTTTLRMIGGFEDPTEGRVFLGGSDVTNHPPYKRDVNTVFQSYALFPHLSVEKNVAFGLERKKVGKAEVTKRANDALELVQLGHLAKRKPAQLSGGQQQRVALARALVNRPRALLLDEPLGALDLRLRKQLQIELKRIQQDVGITFVHVTHDQEEAMSMADTIAVMNGGKIEQAGSRDRPLRAPADGLRGELPRDLEPDRRARSSSRRTRVETHDGAKLHVPERCGRRHRRRARRRAAGEDHPAPGRRGVPDGANVLKGKIVVAAFLGVSIQYVIQAAGGEELNVFAQNTDGAEPDALAVGREVQLAWSPEHTFVVDRG